MARLVTDYLEVTANKFPDKPAFIDEHSSFTFCDLQDSAKRIATRLIDAGLYKEPVAVALGQSVEAIAAFLGAAYAGCFYTPLDIDMPESRVRKILETLEPGAVITNSVYSEKMAAAFGEQKQIWLYDDIVQNQADEEAVADVRKRLIDTDVLYVLFTSGSTGIPKGVIIGHRSVIDYIDWVQETFHIGSGSVLGNQAPFYFDNSVLDIYSTLKTGATAYIIPRKCFAFPIRLLEYVRDKKINTVFWVPSVLTQIANYELLDECDIDCLHTVLFAGEVMPTRHLNLWRKRLPDACFANLYGPTEITVDCTYYIADRELSDAEPVPIGIPCRNSDILVLNEEGKLVQDDEKGELCVRGSSLAYGYYKNPEKTAAAFVQNPLNPCYPERIYRTGDIVHYNARGEIIYDGRKDFQIKHLGHRIELGEIETAAASLSSVKMACCLFDAEKAQIVLCYVGDTAAKELREQLMHLVPEYMVPKRYEQLEAMPLNLNGKIDRVKLNERFAGQ